MLQENFAANDGSWHRIALPSNLQWSGERVCSCQALVSLLKYSLKFRINIDRISQLPKSSTKAELCNILRKKF